MNQLAVFVKRSGVLVACRAYPAPDGCVWECSACGLVPLLRASFGVMSGMFRCQCGAEVELFVDGEIVKLEEVGVKPFPSAVSELKPKRTRRRKMSDEDFLRECGITADATSEEK